MQKYISKLQYITPQPTGDEFLSELEAVCKAGIDWVQLRVKDWSYEDVLDLARKAQAVCKEYDVIFIINDNVSIAQTIKADGIHLGQNDMPPSEARKILGEQAIIGGTANTFEDIQYLVSQGVDYIGCGPFRFTTTKKNLSPIVGLEGYKALTAQMKQAGITTPIVAVGGITQGDIKPIVETGINGVAVSSFIAQAENQKELIESLKPIL